MRPASSCSPAAPCEGPRLRPLGAGAGLRASAGRAAAQVFVANPNKTPAIVSILVSNRDKLLKYLGDFHTDKGARRAPAGACHRARHAAVPRGFAVVSADRSLVRLLADCAYTHVVFCLARGMDDARQACA